MTQVEKRKTDKLLTAGAKVPEAFNSVIGFEAWARSIVYKEKYIEPNPEYISTMLALQSIMADSIEEAFQQANIKGVQEILPDTPSAETDPFEITDLYVASSDFETGNPCFVIITGAWLTSGEEFKFTTGATNIQATLIGLLKNGAWPIRAKFKRGISKDKGGRYLLFLMPPD